MRNTVTCTGGDHVFHDEHDELCRAPSQHYNCKVWCHFAQKFQCPANIELCVCFVFFFLCALCCQFLWIVHFYWSFGNLQRVFKLINQVDCCKRAFIHHSCKVKELVDFEEKTDMWKVYRRTTERHQVMTKAHITLFYQVS